MCEPSSAPAERFYSSASCKTAFQRFLSALVLRVNTISGEDCAFYFEVTPLRHALVHDLKKVYQG